MLGRLLDERTPRYSSCAWHVSYSILSDPRGLRKARPGAEVEREGVAARRRVVPVQAERVEVVEDVFEIGHRRRAV